jgi:pilus assembly protein CpaB
MMRRRLLIPLIVALGLGLLAGALVMRQSARTTPVSEQREKTVKVVVITKELSRGVKLVKGDLELRDWPDRLVTPEFVRNLSEAENRIIISNMVKGEPLMRSKLAAEDSVEGLSTLIPSNRRAFTIRVNDVTGVAGFLLPGSRVDVYATFEIEIPATRGTGVRKTPVTRTILQDVEVLAAGGVQEAGKKKSGSTVPMVTLLLTPEESAKVALAGSSGSIWLSMRNPRDKEKPPLSLVTVDDLLRGEPRVKNAQGPQSQGPQGPSAQNGGAQTPGVQNGGTLTPASVTQAFPDLLAAKVPGGRRAITISVSDVTGVAGFLFPGNLVDVHATFEIDLGGGQKTYVTKTIVQGVELLTAGAVREIEEGKSRIPVALVTILASPDQADRLALASVAAKMWLSLRNFADRKVNEAVKSVWVKDVLKSGTEEKEDKSKAEPKKAAPKVGYVVEIIQGGKTSKTEF